MLSPLADHLHSRWLDTPKSNYRKCYLRMTPLDLAAEQGNRMTFQILFDREAKDFKTGSAKRFDHGHPDVSQLWRRSEANLLDEAIEAEKLDMDKILVEDGIGLLGRYCVADLSKL